DTFAKTAEGQLALADRCASKKLTEQERAHLTAVLDINPENTDARARLGYRRVNGSWVLDDQIRQNEARAKAIAASIKDWRPRLEQIQDGLTKTSLMQREA